MWFNTVRNEPIPKMKKPTQDDIKQARAIATEITKQVFAHYQMEERITDGGKRAAISRTTLAEAVAKGFLAGRISA